jgi:Family of unknown function (DUF6527)
MKRVGQDKDLWDLEPGEFFYTQRGAQMFFNCALPNGAACRIPIRPLVNPLTNGGHSWEWDRNVETPTLSPSINSIGSWHGFVTAGRMVSCP